MRLALSADEPEGFWVTLHPVAAVNGSTQDLSAYPSHSTRLSWPSPGPTVVCGLMFAVGGGASVEPPVLGVEPQAVAPMTSAAAAIQPSRDHTARASGDLIFLPLLAWLCLSLVAPVSTLRGPPEPYAAAFPPHHR